MMNLINKVYRKYDLCKVRFKNLLLKISTINKKSIFNAKKHLSNKFNRMIKVVKK